jgi:hypothetical protein
MFAVSTFCRGTPLSEQKNEVVVLSLRIRLFTCVILLGVAVCKRLVRCGSKRVNAAPSVERWLYAPRARAEPQTRPHSELLQSMPEARSEKVRMCETVTPLYSTPLYFGNLSYWSILEQTRYNSGFRFPPQRWNVDQKICKPKTKSFLKMRFKMSRKRFTRSCDVCAFPYRGTNGPLRFESRIAKLGPRTPLPHDECANFQR